MTGFSCIGTFKIVRGVGKVEVLRFAEDGNVLSCRGLWFGGSSEIFEAVHFPFG